MPYSGGLKRNIAQCLHDYNIPLYLSHTVTRITGIKRVEGVYTAKVDEKLQPLPETETFVPCDTLLLSVGLIPENELSKKIGVTLSPVTGGAVVNDRLETNIPGVFSCGNVLHVHDLADNVTLEAYRAAENAVRYLEKEQDKTPEIPVTPGPGVRYTVPSRLVYEPHQNTPVFEILFRSDNVYKQAVVDVYAGEVLLQSKKKRIVTPGEMERVKVELTEWASDVRVEVRSLDKTL
jgi:NAD(P)H-nitrite reductase large subunit